MNAKSEIISIVKNAFAGYGIGEHCKKYGGKDHRGYDTIMKYEAQNIAEDIISAIESLPMTEDWTLASDCLPAYGQYVLFTMIESNDEDEEIFVYPCFWDEQEAFELSDATLIAWMPAPKPYKKEKITTGIRKK